MVRPRPSDEDDEEDREDEEDPDDDESPPPRHPRRSPRPRSSRGRPAPVRRWSSGGGAEEDDGEEGAEGEERRSRWRRDRTPVFWRARDSLYFGPLVALAIVVVLIASLYAFTQNWPPVYVVESGSMQHGPNDIVGLINTGDLVLAQKIPTQNIQTYIDGMQTGYSTYGEFGDVLLYWPNGAGSTPIIHRAILFLEYDPQVNGYNISSLTDAPCNATSHPVYSTTFTTNDCGTVGVTGTLSLFHIGWMDGTFSLPLSPSVIGAHSGFITMGDNNTLCGSPGCPLLPDQGNGAWLSQLVEPSWVIGAARGLLPWFGAFKLALEGRGSAVPSQSWEFLGLTIAGLILLGLGIHYALRAEGIEDPRRREQEAEEEDEEEEAAEGPPISESRGRRILRSLRPWRSTDEEEDQGPSPSPRSHRTAPKPAPGSRRGRPRPHVRRPAKSKAKKPAAGDDDEDL
ncbi:MAG: S26 family signal peptidase [Thermoplasmata archaeon]